MFTKYNYKKCIYCSKEVTKENQGFENCLDVCIDCATEMAGKD